MTYWQLHYHLIWATQDRQPVLTPLSEKQFYGVLHNKATELGLIIHAVGVVEEHIHLVLSIPPRLSVADCVKHIKGASAFAINHIAGSLGHFHWQEGYGALTISERALEKVKDYVTRQKEHHKEQKTIPVYEKIERDR